jgi:biopolymer transport protein ExbB
MLTNAALDFIKAGGYGFMVPLIALSVLSVAVMVERVFALTARSLPSKETRDRLTGPGATRDLETVSKIVAEDRSLVGTVLRQAIAMSGSHEGAVRLEQAVEHSANAHMPWLTKRLWALRAIGHVAPLLGLMGTVVGLALAFHNIAEVGLSQQSVANGIAMALTTTITGLGIALPTLFAEYCLRAFAESRFRKIDTLLRDFVLNHGGNA